jgi:hypothetical protein
MGEHPGRRTVPSVAGAGALGLRPAVARKLDELTAAHTFVSEAPTNDFTSWFEKRLRGERPENPQWIRAPELERDGNDYGTDLWFYRHSDAVRFRALNPFD